MTTAFLRNTGTRRLLVALILAVLIPALPAGCLWLAGVRSIDWQHAVIRVQISGLDRPGRLEEFNRAMSSLNGFRRGQMARTSLSNDSHWTAEMEFRAGSMTEATVRYLKWKDQFEPPIQIELEQVLYHTLHFHRPNKGDLVFGLSKNPQPTAAIGRK